MQGQQWEWNKDHEVKMVKKKGVKKKGAVSRHNKFHGFSYHFKIP